MQYKSNLKSAWAIVVYDDAGHAFFADYRDSYSAGPLSEAWKRCLNWIGERTSP